MSTTQAGASRRRQVWAQRTVSRTLSNTAHEAQEGDGALSGIQDGGIQDGGIQDGGIQDGGIQEAATGEGGAQGRNETTFVEVKL
jgi:hypothetical protein